MNSFKVVLIERSGHECGNACRFATEAEADESFRELFARWMACPSDYRVDQSEDQANYHMVDGRPRPLRASVAA